MQDEVVEEGRAVDRLHVPDLLYQDGEHADECLLLGVVAVDQGEVDVHELLAREETQQPDPWSWCAILSSSPPSTCSSLQAEGQAHTDTMGKEGGVRVRPNKLVRCLYGMSLYSSMWLV